MIITCCLEGMFFSRKWMIEAKQYLMKLQFVKVSTGFICHHCKGVTLFSTISLQNFCRIFYLINMQNFVHRNLFLTDSIDITIISYGKKHIIQISHIPDTLIFISEQSFLANYFVIFNYQPVKVLSAQ